MRQPWKKLLQGKIKLGELADDNSVHEGLDEIS